MTTYCTMNVMFNNGKTLAIDGVTAEYATAMSTKYKDLKGPLKVWGTFGRDNTLQWGRLGRVMYELQTSEISSITLS